MAIRRISGSDSDSYKNPLKKHGFSTDCGFLQFQRIVDFLIRITDCGFGLQILTIYCVNNFFKCYKSCKNSSNCYNDPFLQSHKDGCYHGQMDAWQRKGSNSIQMKANNKLLFLVAKLLYNYLCPYVRFRGERNFLGP